MTRRWEYAAREALLRREKVLLGQWRHHLEGEQQLLYLGNRESDPVDAAAALANARSLGVLSEANLRELREVRLALERLRTGKYGVCEWCGNSIELERLEALLWTRSCIECASAGDRRFAEGTKPG